MTNFPIPNNLPPQMYRGMIKPFLPKRRKQPVYEQSIPIGNTGKYYTKLQVRVHEADYNFQSPALFIQLGNGNSTTFCKVTLAEMDTILSFLTECRKTITPIMAKEEEKASALRASMDAIENLNRINQVKNMAANWETGDIYEQSNDDAPPDERDGYMDTPDVPPTPKTRRTKA